MAQPRKIDREPIWPVRLKDGRIRYRVVVDAHKGANGRRRQVTSTFDTLRAARAWLARMRTEVADGAYVPRDRRTVSQLLSAWLESRRNIKPSTRECYRGSAWQIDQVLGPMPVQDVTGADAEALVSRLLREHSKRGRPRSARTVRLVVQVAGMAWRWGVRDGWIRHNPWERVELPPQRREEMRRWTADEMRRWLAHAHPAPGGRLATSCARDATRRGNRLTVGGREARCALTDSAAFASECWSRSRGGHPQVC